MLHWITHKGWYAIKHPPSNLPSKQSFVNRNMKKIHKLLNRLYFFENNTKYNLVSMTVIPFPDSKFFSITTYVIASSKYYKHYYCIETTTITTTINLYHVCSFYYGKRWLLVHLTMYNDNTDSTTDTVVTTLTLLQYHIL